MEQQEPVRLVCPECDLVYRVKKLTLGKSYTCKQCGAGLVTMDPVVLACPSCGAATEPAHVDASRLVYCKECREGPPLVPRLFGASGTPEMPGDAAATRVMSENLAAAVSTSSLNPPPPATGGGTRVRPTPHPVVDRPSIDVENQLKRLSALSDTLAARLDALDEAGIRGLAGELSASSRKLLDAAERVDKSMTEQGGELSRTAHDIDGKLVELSERLDFDSLKGLSEQLRETGDLFIRRLDEYQAGQHAALSELFRAAAPSGGGAGAEMDLDSLAGKLAERIEIEIPRSDAELGGAVAALARAADALDRERNENSGLLEKLSAEVKAALSAVSDSESWRGDIPTRVADEIGRTVESRVVGPITTALAQQAPEILSDIQGNKLVDIVSRAVREAQRPLIREIVAGGRGVPVWLFAAVLLPLLMVLGYLFLPGELGAGDRASGNSVAAESLARIETTGVPLNAEADGRIKSIEETVMDLHDGALEHVRNAARLEEEVKNLRTALSERDALIKDYSDMLQKQVKRIRAYEMRLTRLGVSPETVEE